MAVYHYSQRLHSRSISRVRTRYKDCPHKASIKDARDCWRNSRALCVKFSAHTSEACEATDLSLATLLKRGFCSLFLDKKCLYKNEEPVFLFALNQTRLFMRVLQLCLSARRESNELRHRPMRCCSAEVERVRKSI